MKHAAPPKSKKKNHSTLYLAKRLVNGYVRPYYGQLLLAIFFMAVSGGMTALVAQLMQPVLDDVLVNAKSEMIIPVSLAVFVTFGVRGITSYIHTIMMNRIGQYIVSDVQSDLFNKLIMFDLAFFHATPSGNLLSCVVNDVNALRSAVNETMTGIGKSLFTLVFLVIVMFNQDWKLTLAAFFVFPFISGFVVYIGKRLRKLSKTIQYELGVLSNLLSQTFQGIRLVKAYGMEDYEKKKVNEAIHRVRDLNIKAVRVSNMSTPVNEIIVGLIFSSIIAYGGYGVLGGTLTAGQLASFLAAFTLAYEPMKKLAKLNSTLQMGLGASERVFDIIDTPIKIKQNDNALSLHISKPKIEFSNVGFQYESSELLTLDEISFIAPSGQVTALVGASGGGKSTVMNLIPRFYDVNAGAIIIDGHDIRELDMASLRKQISLVSQDITIFNDTIRENIRYGDFSASDEEVENAAKIAAAHDFILGFPAGYSTEVGENGVKLSGGQKQRIAIARALLRDAPILLLDEATSALDNESELLIQEALEELEKGRTTIVIAHRLSTVQTADQIIVMEQGRIAERGRHSDLLAQNGLYAKMYQKGLRNE